MFLCAWGQFYKKNTFFKVVFIAYADLEFLIFKAVSLGNNYETELICLYIGLIFFCSY